MAGELVGPAVALVERQNLVADDLPLGYQLAGLLARVASSQRAVNAPDDGELWLLGGASAVVSVSLVEVNQERLLLAAWSLVHPQQGGLPLHARRPLLLLELEDLVASLLRRAKEGMLGPE